MLSRQPMARRCGNIRIARIFAHRPFLLLKAKLLPACSAFDDVRLADAAFDSGQIFSRALNDGPFEPDPCASKPPDADDQECAQHYHRRVVEVASINWVRCWQHEQDRY